MGGPCDHLVPAAVLYKHPEGLTAEEYSRELAKIGGKEYKYRLEYSWIHQAGMYGLARVLNLPETKEFREWEKGNWDNDFEYDKIRLITPFLKYIKNDDIPKHEVVNSSHKVLGKEFRIETTEYTHNGEGLEIGDYISRDDMRIQIKSFPKRYENASLQVTKVLERKVIKEKHPDDFDETETIGQKLMVRPVRISGKVEIFDSIDDVAEKYPIYAPKKRFNFSKRNGYLFPYEDSEPHRIKSFDIFRWIKKRDKYFLDIPFMLGHLSPNSFYVSGKIGKGWIHQVEDDTSFSLTDLELTAEAIRTEYWDVLKYVGFRHNFGKFIFSSPETLEVHEKAVWDNEMSQLAIKNGWTHTEMLRQRLMMSMNKIPMSFEQKKAGFELGEEIRRQKEKGHEEYLERMHKKEMEERKKRSPF